MPKVREGDKYEKKYREEDVLLALKAIENGLSQRAASKTFKIPRQTLQFRNSQKFQNKISLGPTTVLTSEEENTLEEWIVTGYKKGFPVRKLDIQASVKEFLDANPRENPFNDNFPGDGWYRAFLKRHPVFTHRTPEGVTSASSAISEADIRNWFSLIEEYLKSKGLDHILEDPTRIFNGDETCFSLCPKSFKVLAPRGARNVYEVDSGQSKTNITVMFTFSASGIVTDPMIIYPYKRLPAAIINSVPVDWGIGHSDNGWMKVELFFDYIKNILYPYLKKIGTTFPIILFVDGHSTHKTLKLSQLCTELEIVLIALYPNATRLIQPADVSAFKPLKNGWKKAVLEFRRKNPREALTKEKFAPVLKTVVEECAKVDIVRNGFRASGLYPWNPSAIDFSKCLGAQKKISRKDPEIKQDIPLNTSLSFNQFKDIVGEDKIAIFERIEDFDSGSNDEFILLYKLYREFKNIDSSAERPSGPGRQDGNLLQIDELATGDMDSFEIVVQETLPIIDALELQGVNENNQSIVIEVSGSEEQIMNHLEILQVDEGCDKGNQDTEGTEAVYYDKINLNNVSEDIRTITESPNIEKNTGKLSDCVVWAKTPERKGKKESKRDSFVLTSTIWKKNLMDKLESKKQEEEMKEARKTERSLKKLAVEMKKQEKTKMTKRKNENPEYRIKKRNTTTQKQALLYEEVQNIHKSSPVSSSLQSVNVTHQSHVTSNIFGQESDHETEKPTTKKDELHKEIDNIYTSSPGPSGLESVNLARHSRVIRNIFGNESDDEIEKPDQFSKNATAAGKLCFICTHNITNFIKGIRCYGCIRTFHSKCILKMDTKVNTNELFKCKACLKPKTNI